jgi:hypothetical protein
MLKECLFPYIIHDSNEPKECSTCSFIVYLTLLLEVKSLIFLLFFFHYHTSQCNRSRWDTVMLIILVFYKITFIEAYSS